MSLLMKEEEDSQAGPKEFVTRTEDLLVNKRAVGSIEVTASFIKFVRPQPQQTVTLLTLLIPQNVPYNTTRLQFLCSFDLFNVDAQFETVSISADEINTLIANSTDESKKFLPSDTSFGTALLSPTASGNSSWLPCRSSHACARTSRSPGTCQPATVPATVSPAATSAAWTSI